MGRILEIFMFSFIQFVVVFLLIKLFGDQMIDLAGIFLEFAAPIIDLF